MAVASPVTGNQSVYYVNTNSTTLGYAWLQPVSGTGGYVLVPPNPPSMTGDTVMYMEIDKYNYQDEMRPYSENTSNSAVSSPRFPTVFTVGAVVSGSTVRVTVREVRLPYPLVIAQ